MSELAPEDSYRKTISERAFHETIWYMVNFDSQRKFSFRVARGFLLALWAAISFGIRLVFLIAFLWLLDLSKLPFSIREKLQARSVIELEELRKYEYEPLLGSREIRLLVLHPGRKNDDVSCDLKTVSLDDVNEYEAISYTWGEDSGRHRVRCGNAVIDVTPNLYSALRQFRHKFKNQTLWADALCIDQSNHSERESQVQLMANIYAKASQTLIWLGEETSDVKGWARATYAIQRFFPDKAFSENLGSLTQERRKFQQYHARRLLLGLDNIFTTVHAISVGNLHMRPWFRRKWVIQEVVKSHCPILVCGNERVPWRVWEENAFYFFRYEVPLFTWQNDNKTMQTVTRSILAIMMLRRSDYYPHQGLTAILQMCTSFSCTDPRDHVIAVLGLASDFEPENSHLKPDYSDEVTDAETFRKYALWSIYEKRSLNFLSLGRDPQQRPSWVPNPVAKSSHVTHPLTWTRFRATLEFEPMAKVSDDGQRLCITGVTIDTIMTLGRSPMPPAPAIDGFSKDGVLNICRNWLHACQMVFREYYSECLHLLDLEYERCVPSQQQQLGSWHPSQRNRYLDFIRALVWGQPYESLTLEQTLIDAENYLRTILTDEEVIFDSNGGAYLMISTCNEGRRLCVTTGGRMGFVPSHVEVGDKVCLLYGGSLPYILRDYGDGTHAFIGDCYIDGVMYGELLNSEAGIEIESFTLI